MPLENRDQFAGRPDRSPSAHRECRHGAGFRALRSAPCQHVPLRRLQRRVDIDSRSSVRRRQGKSLPHEVVAAVFDALRLRVLPAAHAGPKARVGLLLVLLPAAGHPVRHRHGACADLRRGHPDEVRRAGVAASPVLARPVPVARRCSRCPDGVLPGRQHHDALLGAASGAGSGAADDAF